MSVLVNRVVWVSITALLVFLAWFFGDILAYVLIAAVVWFILTPLVNFLDYTSIKGRSLPRWVATLLALGMFFTLLTAVGMFFIPKIVEQASLLANLDIDYLIWQLGDGFASVDEAMRKYGISQDPAQDLSNYLKTKVVGFFGQMGDVVGYLFGLTGNVVVGLFAVLFISFFFLKDESLVRRIIHGATPEMHQERVSKVMTNAKRLLSRYFIGLLIQVTIISGLVSLGLMAMGIDNALLIGSFAGIINVIPYIGPIIGTGFGVFVVFTGELQAGVGPEIGMLLVQVLAVFLVVQTLDNLVFQPVIFSNSVNAHPIEIFLIIFIAGKLGGIVGMICAIPAYTLFRIIAKEFLTQFTIIKNLTKNI
ncbi:MAG: AI-2E family transporter [Bacteroidetes bacterium]|nr:AI-2E family transporter [Bacteroidota bacterium]